ncbi:MAG: hypothetical protein ACI8XO_005071 [Verrucomicrobiales bacterium]|jgi:hypothetical protein
MNRQQSRVIEYPQEEIRVLKHQQGIRRSRKIDYSPAKYFILLP